MYGRICIVRIVTVVAGADGRKESNWDLKFVERVNYVSAMIGKPAQKIGGIVEMRRTTVFQHLLEWRQQTVGERDEFGNFRAIGPEL